MVSVERFCDVYESSSDTCVTLFYVDVKCSAYMKFHSSCCHQTHWLCVLCRGSDCSCFHLSKSDTMDAVYPEPLSRLHRRAVRKQVHRGSGGRYRTQPVTFAEIKETSTTETTAASASKSELDLNSKFEQFWRAGREKAKEKKQRKARESRKSESDVMMDDETMTTSTIIKPTSSIPTTPPINDKPRPSL
ncbi:hypothetical protein C0J52_20735 [Blattella germanica]|nr:hypothetical protein C0J52_20735 [Blattella germanica]